jgi:hypothetical protein
LTSEQHRKLAGVTWGSWFLALAQEQALRCGPKKIARATRGSDCGVA